MTLGSALSLNIEAPSTTIFVTYAGKLSNQCGLRLVSPDDTGVGIVTNEMVENLVVKLSDHNGGETLSPKINHDTIEFDFSHYVLNRQTFGIDIILETKNGHNLSTIVGSNDRPLLIISVPCVLER